MNPECDMQSRSFAGSVGRTNKLQEVVPSVRMYCRNQYMVDTRAVRSVKKGFPLKRIPRRREV